MRCLYRVLGLSSHATKTEIKKQFYKLSKLYHPDLQGSEVDISWKKEKFTEISNAYSILMDDSLRRDYDKKNNAEHDVSYVYRPKPKQWYNQRSHEWESTRNKTESDKETVYYDLFAGRWDNVQKRTTFDQRRFEEQAKAMREEQYRVVRNRFIVIGAGIILYLLVSK